MGFYGYHMGAEIWLPFLGVFLLALLIRRSWQPLRNLLSGLWREWTILSLGIYILYASVFMVYDENHHPYLLAFIALTTMASCLGAWGYFRSDSPLRRVLALVVGLVLAAILSGISYATWDYRAYYGLPKGGTNDNLILLIFIAVLALIMGANGLLAHWRLTRASRMKES
jgi:succinate dehydrogenase/fumarate reductase cytochrome b subunit